MFRSSHSASNSTRSFLQAFETLSSLTWCPLQAFETHSSLTWWPLQDVETVSSLTRCPFKVAEIYSSHIRVSNTAVNIRNSRHPTMQKSRNFAFRPIFYTFLCKKARLFVKIAYLCTCIPKGVQDIVGSTLPITTSDKRANLQKSVGA